MTDSETDVNKSGIFDILNNTPRTALFETTVFQHPQLTVRVIPCFPRTYYLLSPSVIIIFI